MRRYQRCSCMNNQAWNTSTNMIEDKCNNDCSTNCSYEQQEPVDCCECGFDEEYEMSVFPDNPMLAQSYVPWQYMDKTFRPEIGLKMGTIFPELVSPYTPCQSMRTNEFLETTNQIGEGCNNVAITELGLYLDTHVDDQKALCLHRKYCKEYRELTDKYQKVYGPLTIQFPCNKWRWIEEPWPWERGNF